MPHPLEQRINGIGRQVRRLTLTHGLAWVVGSGVAVCLMLGLLDYIIRFQDRGVRLILSATAAGFFGWIAYRYLASAIRARFQDVDLAIRVEKHFPQLSDRLSSTVHFLKESEEDPQAGSPVLRRAVISQTWAEIEHLDLTQAIERRPVIRAAVIAFAVCLIAAGFVFADRQSAGIAVARMFHPLGSSRWPQVNHLSFREAPKRLLSGGRFEATLVDSGGKPLPDDVRIHFRHEGEDAAHARSEPMQSIGDTLVASKEDVTRPFSYRATGGDDDSMEWIPLAVVDAPAVDSLSIMLHYPEYTGIPPAKVDQRISAIQGTRVELKGTTTRQLRSASVQQDSGSTVAAIVASGGFGFSISAQAAEPFMVEKSGSYWFELVDQENLIGGREVVYDIQSIPDAAPTVLIEQPAANAYVTPSALVPLRVTVKEDLAIHDIELRFIRSDRSDVGELVMPLYSGSERAAPPLATGGQGETRTVEYAWDLAQANQLWSDLKPGTVVRFLATARDYKPQTGQSTPRQLTIVTPDELEDRIAERQSFILQELQRVLKLQQESRSQVQGLQIQMEQVGRLTQQDADQLQGAQLIQQQVDRGLTSDSEGIPGHIASLVSDLENNRLNTPDIGRRMQEISDEFQRLGKEQLPVIRREMTSALKGTQNITDQSGQPTAAGPVGQSIAETGKQQDQVIASLEGLLGDLAQWDSFRRLSRDLGQLLRDQEQLTLDTAAMGRETITQDLKDLTSQQQADLKKLSQRQTEFAQRLDDIERQMQQSQSGMETDEPLSAESIADALEHTRQRAVSGQMRGSSQNIERNQVGQAAVQQQQAAADLQEMLDILSNRREHELGRLVKKLKEAESELAALRQQQQGLRKQMNRAATNPDEQQRRRELERLSRQERELQQRADRFARRLQRLQADQAGKQVSQAGGKMGQSGQQGEQGDASAAAEQAQQAEQDLDDAQTQLAQRRQQAEEDLAREQLAQIEDALKGLSARQQKVVDETRRLDEIQKSEGRRTRGQAASVQGVAAEEDLVRKETMALAKKLASAEVFSLALGGSAAEAERAVTLLNQRDCGPATQLAESNALRRFQQLLEVLKPDANDTKQQGQQEDQSGGEGGQQGGPQGDTVRMLAELKLLKLLQQELNQRTQSLDVSFRRDNQLSAEEQREYVRLGDEQGKLADLALNYAQAAEPDGEDNPEKIPELDDLLPDTGRQSPPRVEGEP